MFSSVLRAHSSRFLPMLCIAAWAMGSVDVALAQGYRLSRSQVIVETQRHWGNWVFAQGTLHIDGGQVQPSVMRRNTNAVFDIVDFLRLNTPSSIKKDPEDIEPVSYTHLTLPTKRIV